MGQRCVHYTERDNGTRVLYAPNQCVELNDSSIVVQLPQNVLFIIVIMFVTCTPVRGFGQNKKNLNSFKAHEYISIFKPRLLTRRSGEWEFVPRLPGK